MLKRIVFFLIILSTFHMANSQTSNPQTDWQIGLQLWTFNHFTFTEAITKADSCGIKFIQAYPGQKLGGTWQGGFDANTTSEQRAAIKEFLKSKGVTITSFGVYGADNEAEWKKTFDFLKEMNIPILVAEPQDDQWDFINKLAGEYNIKVAIHDHPRPSHYWNPDTVIAAMKGHPNIGACADVGHWARSGLNPVECLKKLEGHIWSVHLKDIVQFDKTDAADTIPGKGVIDFPAVFKELQRQNFKGMFAIEHESNWENNAGDVIEIVKFYHEQVAALKP